MNQVLSSARQGLRGELLVHGDKSITHRAFIFSAIGCGSSKIENANQSVDCQSTIECLLGLGAKINKVSDSEYHIEGQGLYGLKEPEDILFAGNSGTTARILPAVLAAQPFASFLTGDSSLRRRPMDRIIRPLAKMGALITGRANNSYLPICIHGKALKGINENLNVSSAQVKTALILAGLYAGKQTVITEPAQSRDHTERMLKDMGANISVSGPKIIVRPGEITNKDVYIPGDISSASFFIIAALLVKDSEILLKNVGLNPTRTAILDLLNRMGTSLSIESKEKSVEPYGDITVKSSKMEALTIEGDIVPRIIDEIPVISVAATQAEGRTVIKDASELRVKESDRIKAMAEGLQKMGAKVKELDDGMIIDGPVKLKGAIVDSYGDHRVAMSFAVAALVAEGETTINNFDCVKISYPEFYKDLQLLIGE